MDEAGAAYDAIAEWYDAYVGGPIFEELVLPSVVELAGDVAGLRLVDVACGQRSVPISTRSLTPVSGSSVFESPERRDVEQIRFPVTRRCRRSRLSERGPASEACA
jgi:hypothetical protein